MARPTAEERFLAKVEIDPETGCWLWTGCLMRDGYGHFRAYGKVVLVHRFSYENWIGPIPEGLTIDHLCRVRHCAAPLHLEPVSIAVNKRRGTALITHCPQGHPYEGKNLYVNASGHRYCLTCRTAASLRSRHARIRAEGREVGLPNASKTHCPQGHPYEGDNLAIYDGRRYCRACYREKDRRASARRRQAGH